MAKTKKVILKIFLAIIVVLSIIVLSIAGYGFYQMFDYFKEHIYMNPQERQEYIHRFDADRYFQDTKVVEFCNAIRDNNFQKADELIKQGVDVNYQGEGGITPALWLLRKTDEGEQKKKGLKYLLDKSANPIVLYHTKTRGDQTSLHTTAQHQDLDYLKMILESGNIKKEDIDFELLKGTLLKTALTQAYSSDRFENFKMLLDYGANADYIIDDFEQQTLLARSATVNLWKYTYELLKRGADYEYAMERGLKRSIGKSYSPISWFQLDGADYQLKSWQFLKDKGINLELNLWPNQKYTKENGKYVLYVNESINNEGGKVEGKEDKWIKYKDSSFYKNLSEKDREKIKQEENAIYELQGSIANQINKINS